MSDKTQCPKHGLQREAYVCVHVAQTREDTTPRGFIWARDDEGEINAYCDVCDELLEKHSGEWNAETEKAADMHAICEACAAEVAELNGEDIR